MPRFVVRVGEEGDGTSADSLGGKGASLCRLARAGFPVPPAFVITTEAFREVAGDGLLLGCQSADEATARILAAPLPPELVKEIAAAYGDLTLRAPLVAVRSSATSEDGEHGSMAGLGFTRLGVAGLEALLDALRQVWASLFREPALLYEPAPTSAAASRTLSLAAQPPEMAVVVQALVPAEAAGVLFTANPVSGNRDEALLQAAYGLGQSVVDGAAADTFLLDRRHGAVASSRIAGKHERLIATAAGPQRAAVDEVQAVAPAVSPLTALEILSLGERIERWAGAPQDIEWALVGKTLWVLQARPITALRRGRGRRVLWSNANVGESLPGVPSPLTWSIIGDYARRGFTDAFAGLGLKIPEGWDFVGSVRGRVYLNLTQLLAIIGQIPFLSARTMLAVAGVGSTALPDVPVEKISPVGFLARLPLSGLRFVAKNFTAPLTASLSERRYAGQRDRLLAMDLDRLGRDGLAERLAEVHALLNDRGGLLLSVSSNFLASWVACREFLRLTGAEAAEDDLGTLFSGLGGVASAEPGLELLDLAHMARADAHTAAALLSDLEGDALAQRLAEAPGGRRFAAAIDRFIERFGLRAAREAEISTARWRDDPSFVLDVVRRHLEAPNLPTSAERRAARERLRADATRRVAGSLPRPLRAFFRRLLGHSQTAERLREQLRTQVVEVLGLYRHVFLGIGRRLVADGLAASADDVFLLSLDEVESYLAGAPLFHLPYRIAYRRARLQVLAASPAPADTFVVGEGEPAPSYQPPPPGDGPLLYGSPASPGRAVGRVRVVRDPKRAPLRHGEILVAPFADAGWTPLFLVAAAVVLETGGPLSHACVVAREMGVPVVTGVPHATTRLRDGDLVTVDAHAGLVQLTVARKRLPVIGPAEGEDEDELALARSRLSRQR